jgi:hypothetical protein
LIRRAREPELTADLWERVGDLPTNMTGLAGMDVEAGADEVKVSLHPRDGEQLDVTQLRTCVDYTVAKAQGGECLLARFRKRRAW